MTRRYYNYTISSGDFSRSPADETFQAGKVYTVRLKITAKKNCGFSPYTEFYINDNPAVVESISYDEQGSAVVSYTFAQKGDVNKDTYVNDKDAKIILSYAGGLSDLTAEQKNIADVNGDGETALLMLWLFCDKTKTYTHN